MKAAVETDGNDTLVMRGTGGSSGGISGRLKYEARVKIIADGGTTAAEAGAITVTNANEVTLLIAAATSYKKFDDVSGDPEGVVKQHLAAAARKPFAKLRAAHVADYQALFRRVTIDLGRSEAMKLPTDVRIQRFAEGNDPELAALYYQFGRYLLISCSRPGGQPATLQGLWNPSLNPPWGSKYTININTEMNYWPAESGGLPECVEPLIAMVNDLTVTGARTAREMYGARGWVVHTISNIWGYTSPGEHPSWGQFPAAAGWLCSHLWEHYLYSRDRKFLERAYPTMKGSARFYLDFLVPEPKNGWLVTAPSNSPENAFCDECGGDLEERPQSRAVDYAAPRSYTPKHLTEKILTTRSAMEGEPLPIALRRWRASCGLATTQSNRVG